MVEEFFAKMLHFRYYCYMSNDDTKRLSEVLRTHNVSVTSPRLEIFETLSKAEKPLKNGEIVKRTPNVDRVSVYRNLELFSKLGITETIIQGWTPLTELAAPFRVHHHHMTCERCGKVIEIEDGVLESALNAIVSKHNFLLNKHLVELTGLCEECQAE